MSRTNFLQCPSTYEVALKARVSKSTVSHVINGTRFVGEETKQHILRVIDELGYRRSIAARSLTTNRTQTIGIIVSDTTNYFFGELLRGLEKVFSAANYSLLVCNTDETLEREEFYRNLLLDQQVDGIIAAATTQGWGALEMAELKHMPIVFVDRTFDGMNDRSYVGANNTTGAYLGAQHLIECGYREIGILAGFQRLSSMRDRLTGFQQALADQHIPLLEEWVFRYLLSPNAGREAATHLLSLPNRPQALFVNNNLLSIVALLAI